MKFEFINQYNNYNTMIGEKTLHNDFDYFTIHQEWLNLSEEDLYLAFYIIIFGFGVEIII